MSENQNDKTFVIRKKHYLVISSWFVFGMLFGYLALEYNELFLIPLLLLFFSVGFWSIKVKCPRCKKPIYLNPNPLKFLGITNYTWTPWLPANCTKCGLDFK
jgi:hypothetical protein